MQLSDENLNIPVRLFLPAIFILFVVVVMTAFIAWSTWQNLDRDRNNAVKWLLREADALTHVMEIDAGAQVREGREISAALEQLMMTMGATENMAYIYCLDSRTGEIFQTLAHKNRSHEIRNPLSSIRGFAQFFAHLFKDHEEHREYAMIMVKEIDRINGVITDLLTFARPLKLHRKRVNAKALVRHILCLIEGDSRSRGVVISMEIDDTMAPLFVDEDQMKQVLLNLVINGLNALEPGQHITVGGVGKPADSWGYLWIEDEGPGIPPGDQQRIFNPFFSGGNKGTGLGLAIAGKIVENHGGRLAVESPAPGKAKGSRFTIFLPMTKKGDAC